MKNGCLVFGLFFLIVFGPVAGQEVSGDGNIRDFVLRDDFIGMKNYLSEKRLSESVKKARIESAIFFTAENGSVEMMQLLAEDLRQKITITDQYSRTPVHVAAECGNVDVLAYLIEKRKLNPEEKSSFDLTPLHRACIAGKLNSVRYLVEKADVRIESKTTDGRTPLSAAANWGQMDIFKYLLDEAGADIRDESVMVLASSSKNPAIADLVKEKLSQNEKVAMGSKFNAADREKIFGMMQQGDITGFLEAKRNYSGDFWAIKNRRGDSVIEYAVSWSPFDMTKCVFSEYPNNFSSGEQFELLKTAVLVGKDEILRYLIEEKRFNPRLDINGVDIFHYATTAPLYPRAEVVRYLVTQQHFDVEKRDPSGKTALLRAANTALYDFTVKCLIEELGADISAKDSAGMNVFQAAALNRQGPAVLEYLVKKFTPDVEKEVGTAVFSTVQNTATKAFLQQYF